MASQYRTPYVNPSTPNIHFNDHDDDEEEDHDKREYYHPQPQQQQPYLGAHPDDYPPPPLPKHNEYYPPLPTLHATSPYSHAPSPSFTSTSTLPPKGSTDVDVESGYGPGAFPAPAEKPAQEIRWWEAVIPNSWACRLYIGVVIVQTIIDLVVEADLFIRIRDNRQIDPAFARQESVYLGIFALAHVFQLALAIDAVSARNILQFIGLTVLNLMFLAYAALQTGEVSLKLSLTTIPTTIPMGALTGILLATISLAELAYIGLGWQIYREFGWQVYKFLGADRNIKRIYAHYQIFQCLVKFDVFFWAGFTSQLIFLVLKEDDSEYYLTILALPLSILLLIEGHLAARYENRWLMLSFMLGCIGALVYSVYKMVKIWAGKDTVFRDSYKTLTVFAGISILFLLTTFIWACMVMSNFNAGLKKQMSKKAAQSSQLRRAGTIRFDPNGFAAAANAKRMSID